jgi:chorismate mutase
VAVRAVRGATQVSADDRDEILARTSELVTAVLQRNEIDPDNLISVIFTATPDLTAEFPAYAARLLGLTDVPLLCTTEIAVPGAMPRVLRLLAHVETDRPRSDIRHVYLGGRPAHGSPAVVPPHPATQLQRAVRWAGRRRRTSL